MTLLAGKGHLLGTSDNAELKKKIEQLKTELATHQKNIPSEASYGFNDRLHSRDSGKIVGLDDGPEIADVTGIRTTYEWDQQVRPRHFGQVNVAFYDAHVENLAPGAIHPAGCANQIRYWMPSIDLRELPCEK